jgi:L-iditol 2-dehydrogenase
VVAFDLHPWRVQQALEFGADLAINGTGDQPLEALREINDGRGADSVIITPNGIKPIEFGLGLAGKGATVLFFAPPHPDGTLTLHPTPDLFFREITLTTTYSCNHIDTAQTLAFIASGRLRAQDMITHRFGLDRVADGIGVVRDAGESIKVIIKPALTPGLGEAA